jgi:putative ABC transport system substrate-binding protein
VAVLGNSTEPGHARSLRDTELAARRLGVQIQYREVADSNSISAAFEAVSKRHADAILILPGTVFNFSRKQIIDLALKSRRPAMYYSPEWAEDGGLMSYGVNIDELFRRAAYYVDRILKGAKPANMPVEQPRKFELVINLNTARQIGLTIPPDVLALTHKVIK